MITLEELEKHFLEKITPSKGAMPWQQRAWERFLQIGLPDKSWESYRYVKLRAIYQSPIAAPCFSMPSLPSGVVALPLQDAYHDFRSYLEKQFANWLSYEKDSFALLSTALSTEGLFIFVPPNTVLEEPILMQSPQQLVIYMGAGSSMKLRLLRTQHSCGWMHRKTMISLDQHAKLSMQLETEPTEGVLSDTFRVNVKQGACFQNLSLPVATSFSRQDYHVRLEAEQAQAKLYGLIQATGNSQQHTHVLMEHLAANSSSLQHFKAALTDQVKHSFEGKIYIHACAQQVNAYQRHNTLILSDKAESKSKPNLEIFADDVKASHGATCGKIDEQALFYLLSRGIHFKQAHQMLVDAFCKEVLDGILL